MGPEDLTTLLSYIPRNPTPELLSGLDDDAAAFRIDQDLAVVQSVDFITPIVNDPHGFGAIAAANALSDIYAMGATPIFALNIVSFPIKSMPMETLGSILAGGAQKAQEAGISIVGGHSIDDSIPKYGLSVTGLVHPSKLIRKTGAQVGDVLILTKPIGTGILATGVDQGMVGQDVELVLTQIMSELNDKAARIMASYPVHACTDVSGYGLLGHLREMLGAELTAVLSYPKIPIISQVWDILKYGAISSGTQSNARYLRDMILWDKELSQLEQIVLADAQTSGGLLMAVSEETAPRLIAELETAGTLCASQIGRIESRQKQAIIVNT